MSQASNKPKSPEQIAALGAARFLNAKLDEIPDENRIADFCEIGTKDDSLAIVKACIPLVEPVAWVIGCRRRTAEREQQKREADNEPSR